MSLDNLLLEVFLTAFRRVNPANLFPFQIMVSNLDTHNVGPFACGIE